MAAGKRLDASVNTSTHWAYILASQPRGTLYIGMTNNIIERVEQHRKGIGSEFLRKYHVLMLVWRWHGLMLRAAH
jgi:putative endonuclease